MSTFMSSNVPRSAPSNKGLQPTRFGPLSRASAYPRRARDARLGAAEAQNR